MSTQSNDELETITQSVVPDHLGQAFDLLRESKEVERADSDSLSKLKERRIAISCIIHSFCVLDSVVNYFGDELFFDLDSQRFVKETERDMPFKKLLKSWNKMSCLDKLQLVLYYSDSRELQANLAARLRELNILRNWLVHGFTYKTTFLLESSPEKGEGTFTVVDYEESIDWRKKFPNTKFNSLGGLYFEDARKALTIVLEALELLSDIFLIPFEFIGNPRFGYQFLYGPCFNIPKVIEKNISSANEDSNSNKVGPS